MWDVFVSHASEDKEDVARPLAEALLRLGISVWFDDLLEIGDSLSESIDTGIAQSNYGIVILSPRFFDKAWPKRELEGLVAKEISTGKTILPVWHELSHADVVRHSPSLANKVGVSTEQGIDLH